MARSHRAQKFPVPDHRPRVDMERKSLRIVFRFRESLLPYLGEFPVQRFSAASRFIPVMSPDIRIGQPDGSMI